MESFIPQQNVTIILIDKFVAPAALAAAAGSESCGMGAGRN